MSIPVETEFKTTLIFVVRQHPVSLLSGQE